MLFTLHCFRQGIHCTPFTYTQTYTHGNTEVRALNERRRFFFYWDCCCYCVFFFLLKRSTIQYNESDVNVPAVTKCIWFLSMCSDLIFACICMFGLLLFYFSSANTIYVNVFVTQRVFSFYKTEKV